MSSNPLVTVVTPSFNQAKFLEETLRSVALQTYRPIQHVVMDGASTDGSVEILKRCATEFQSPDYSLDWVSEKDRGFADALGKGFLRSQGKIVGWLNSDDLYFDRYTVAKAVDELEKHSDVDVVFGDVALISEDSGLRMVWCFPKFNYKRVLRNYILPQPTVFMRRSVVEEHPLDGRFSVALDHLYWLQIGRKHKFCHLGRVQAADRDHGNRMTRAKMSTSKSEGMQLLEAYGDGYRPTSIDHYYDLAVKVLLRFKGALHLARILGRRNLNKELAFPMWLDSRSKLFRRQFTMRIGSRPDLGPRPISVASPAVIERSTSH
jgi:glycosyltransferase involved in cell wall biosynthesis